MIVFDVDGTILPGTSCERLFVRHLIKRKVLLPRHFINFCLRAIALAPYGRAYMTKANKGYLRGFSCLDLDMIGKEFFDHGIAPLISKAAIARIGEHIAAGERVILLSGMPDFLLVNFSKFLGIEEFYGSNMEIRHDRFTGKTLGIFPLGRGKVVILERIISGKATSSPGDYELLPVEGETPSAAELSDVTFYGDHWLDRFLFSRVGYPVVVNAQKKLARLALERGWRSEIFQ